MTATSCRFCGADVHEIKRPYYPDAVLCANGHVEYGRSTYPELVGGRIINTATPSRPMRTRQ